MQNESILPIVKKYGLLAAAGMLILSLITILISDPSSMSSLIMIGIISFVGSAIIFIGISILAIKSLRDDVQSGIISFGEALKVSFLPLLIGVMASLLFSWVHGNFIDPDYAQTMAESLGAFMEKQGLPESQIEEQVEKLKDAGSLTNILKTGLISAAVALIVSAITSAVMKKAPPSDILNA